MQDLFRILVLGSCQDIVLILIRILAGIQGRILPRYEQVLVQDPSRIYTSRLFIVALPSLNPVHVLRKPGRTFQDPKSQESYQILFMILSRILVIPDCRVSHGQTGSFSGFVQVPAQIFF